MPEEEEGEEEEDIFLTSVIPQILRWQLYVIAFSCKSENCIHLMMV